MAALSYAEELVRDASGLTAEELVSGKVKIEKYKPKKEEKEPSQKPELSKSEVRKILNSFKKSSPKRPLKFMAARPSLRPVQQVISKEQAFLQELFGGGERTFGTGQNLPKLNHALTSGNGLIKSGDMGETGSLFGLRR